MLPQSQLQLLEILNHEKVMSVTQIADRFGIAKSNITPLIDKMEQDKLVNRVHSQLDRRVVNVSITDNGKQRLDLIHRTLNERIRQWLELLSDSERDELGYAIKVMLNAFYRFI